MIIGIVLSSSPGYSETFLSSKISGLQKQGHTVILFCQEVLPDFSLCKTVTLPNSSISSMYLPLKVVFTYLSLLFHIKSVYRFYQFEHKAKIPLKTILKKLYFNAAFLKSKLDWLHFGFGTLAVGREHIAKAIGSKMAVSFRGFDIGIYPLKNPNCYEGLWAKVDKIHVISDDIRDLLYANGFSGESEVIKITPSIDTSLFKSGQREFTTNKNQFITIARLHWKKGLEYTLEALALLKKEGIHFHYTIIGDGLEYERLKFAAHQLEIEDEVTFAGKIAHEQITSELNKADMYLQYSIQEGFCNAVLEAQALGLLCIVSNAEGLSENVLDNQTGWVVPKCNSKGFAAKLLEVIHLESSEKKRISRNAQKRVADHFSIEKQKLEFINFYSS